MPVLNSSSGYLHRWRCVVLSADATTTSVERENVFEMIKIFPTNVGPSFEEERREGGRILFRQFASFSLQLKQAKTVNALKRKTSSRYIVTDG